MPVGWPCEPCTHEIKLAHDSCSPLWVMPSPIRCVCQYRAQGGSTASTGHGEGVAGCRAAYRAQGGGIRCVAAPDSLKAKKNVATLNPSESCAAERPTAIMAQSSPAIGCATYLVGRERAVLFALPGIGVPTSLHKVNVARQRDRDMQSFMAHANCNEVAQMRRNPHSRPHTQRL